MSDANGTLHHPPHGAAHGPGDAVERAETLPVRTISTGDLRDALRLGYADFVAKPSHIAFIALIYPIAGIVLAQLTVSYNIFPLLFPLLGGFALLGPFAAIGLYDRAGYTVVSTRRRYYQPGDVDALVMRRILSDGEVGGE